MRIRGGAPWGAAMLVCLTLLSGLPMPGVTAEPQLRLDYQPPLLQVEAHAVPFADVLRAIGERVGFLVIEAGGTQPLLTVSVRGLVERVLSKLLVETHHALVYRARAKGAAEPAPSPDLFVKFIGLVNREKMSVIEVGSRKSSPRPGSASA